MSEREDLLSRLRSVDEVLAGARPRAAQEARLLARLRAADRAAQPSSSSSSPSLLLAVQRAWRPLGVTAGLCAALALALALRAGDQAQRSVEASTSRGNAGEERDLEPTATRLSSTASPPRPRAEGPQHRTQPSEDRGEREPTPTAPAPALPEATEWPAPLRPAPWGSELPAPSPRLSSRDDPPQPRTAWTPARDPRISSAAGSQGALARSGLDEPRVLWAEGPSDRSEAAPKPGASPAPRGQTTSPASGPRASGCEPAESLVDRARADCEAQALVLSDHGLAYLDACGEGQFRGLDYACAPPSAPHSPPPNSKAPAGCVVESLPADGTCKTEEATRLEALQWCEEAALTLADLTLDPGACSDGFQEARVLCCEKTPDDPTGKSLPRTDQALPDDDDPDSTN